MISINDITKTYTHKLQKITALDRVSLNIKRGELFGLIGPDGAGKTSLFRILTTLVAADSGSATVCGFDTATDLVQIRRRVGYMPERFSLYQDLSVEENLNFFAHIFGTTVAKNYDIIRDIYVQIEPFRTRRAGKLSGGMKQKLALCCALVHRPEVLFLDEPTTGVDPVSRREFWAILRTLNAAGMTIMVSTPYMDEAVLCERIALMQNGKILSIDTPQNVVNQNKNVIFEIRSADNYALLETLRTHPNVKQCFMFGDTLHTIFAHNILPSDIPQDIEIQQIEPNIEDCFIELMRK